MRLPTALMASSKNAPNTQRRCSVPFALSEARIFFGPTRPGTVWCQPVLPAADANLDVLDVDARGCVSCAVSEGAGSDQYAPENLGVGMV